MTHLMSSIKPLFWLSVIVLTLASLVPIQLLPPQSFDVWDKAQHALGFGWLAFFGLLSYPQRPARVAGYLLVHGAVIELAQSATGWRYGEWSDLAADGVGILLGTLAWWALRRGLRPAS
ncbi:MAG: VanZ family protein [Gammaproteobacteria bacterium]